MAHNDRIKSAIADLESQRRPNIAETAKKWNVARTTLSDRFKGKSTSAAEAVSDTHKKLTTTEEETLIAHINKLSNRGLPPTPQFVKNLAEEIADKPIGKNWVARFVDRYKDQLSSIYLRTIDHKRKTADNSEHFQHYFYNVGALFGFPCIGLVSYLALSALCLCFWLSSTRRLRSITYLILIFIISTRKAS